MGASKRDEDADCCQRGRRAQAARNHRPRPARGGPLLDTALPNDLATTGEDLHLVLDDYHVVTEADLHRSVAYLLAHQPPCLHLVLATRSEPPLPFGRLRAHGELLEIRAADLAFTDTEATTMLNGALALGLDVDDVERLSRRTEGWAAGLCKSPRGGAKSR